MHNYILFYFHNAINTEILLRLLFEGEFRKMLNSCALSNEVFKLQKYSYALKRFKTTI